MYGLDNRGPITGKDLRKVTITPKKSPNKAKIPKHSIAKPTNEYFIRIKMIPKKKKTDPRILLGLEKKKEKVRRSPIINKIPLRNKTFPNANKAESKKVINPRAKKKTPNRKVE